MENRTIHTISELNQMVRSLLEDAFPPLWVEGEISNFSCPSSGHWYFSLKDSDAQIRCAMFQGKNRVLGFKPENGAQVLVRGKVSLYEPRGDFQFIADFMEEAGDGALRRAFELLKSKLAAEGLFDPAHKKSLPVLPKTIGVVTSPTGAAIRDIISILKRRFPSIPIIIYPTAVQGSQAAAQIVNAIQLANARKECDVLIIGRGGGSLEDLWPFNEENVARAVYASEIPTVSAVGHEIDFTITDFVADQRASTPSAAAELLSPDQAEYQQYLEKTLQRLKRRILEKLADTYQTLTYLNKRLRHPGQRIQDQSQRLDDLEQRLQRGLQNFFKQQQHQLANLARALNAISPLATLERGYTITTLNKQILHDVQAVKIGDQIATKLRQGELLSTVITIKN